MKYKIYNRVNKTVNIEVNNNKLYSSMLEIMKDPEVIFINIDDEKIQKHINKNRMFYIYNKPKMLTLDYINSIIEEFKLYNNYNLDLAALFHVFDSDLIYEIIKNHHNNDNLNKISGHYNASLGYDTILYLIEHNDFLPKLHKYNYIILNKNNELILYNDFNKILLQKIDITNFYNIISYYNLNNKLIQI